MIEIFYPFQFSFMSLYILLINLDHIYFFQPAELKFYYVNDHYFWNGDKDMCQFF